MGEPPSRSTIHHDHSYTEHNRFLLNLDGAIRGNMPRADHLVGSYYWVYLCRGAAVSGVQIYGASSTWVVLYIQVAPGEHGYRERPDNPASRDQVGVRFVCLIILH